MDEVVKALKEIVPKSYHGATASEVCDHLNWEINATRKALRKLVYEGIVLQINMDRAYYTLQAYERQQSP